MQNRNMATRSITQVRHRRLLEFVSGFETEAEAAAALGISPGYLSQLKMGSKPGRKTGRNIGERLARSMERAAVLPNLWFDGIESASAALSADEVTLVSRYRKVSPQARLNVLGWLAIEQQNQAEADREPLPRRAPKRRNHPPKKK